MLRRLVAGLIVATAIAGPIVEWFDRWDRTLQDGNDIEGTCVVVAFCGGVALTLAAARRPTNPLSVSRRPCPVTRASKRRLDDGHVDEVLFGFSPPVPLRI